MYLLKPFPALQAAYFLLLPFIVSAQTYYTQPCPLLDLSYPALSSYASSNVIQSAMDTLNQNVTQALNQTTAYGQLDSQSNAFSIDVYSLHDEQSLFVYNYTPDALIAQHSVGVQELDTNSVFRVASVSKLMTVYIYLIAVGDETWNQPVTKFVPELAAYAEMNRAQLQDDTINFVDWNSITVGSLANQLGGIAREVSYSPGFEKALQSLGLPPVPRNQSDFCGDDVFKTACNRQAFFDTYLEQRPFTAPFVTPIYSNVAYQIFAYALENITGKAMSDLFNEALVEGLSLNSTYYSIPPSPNTSFVPINTTVSLWNVDARDETPAGGYFTSANDLRTIGKSILNFTLLTPAQTRRWMKPNAFTSNLKFAVGAPWEIVQAPGEPVSWIYSKTGNFGVYSSIVALLPEYNIGITVLGAGASSGDAVRILSDLVVDNVVPAVYAATQAGAASAYTGTYSSSNTTNSSITVSIPDSGPGLVISDWTLNGTDVLPMLATLLGLNSTTQSLNTTLYPSGLKSDNGTTVSWRALFRINPQPLDPGPFSENCVSWGMANTIDYGTVGLDEFLFTLDQNGDASSIEPRVTGSDLLRANGTMMPRSLRRLR